MARENKTRFAVLGLLLWGPMSGYDMKKAIDRSLGHFWTESYGQLYPILTELAAAGLATKQVQPGDGKPDRHVYAITDAGRTVILDWLAYPAEPVKYRLEVLLKLIYSGYLPPAERLAHVTRFRTEQQALLEQYTAIEAHLESRHAGNPHAPYWLITVRCGIHTVRAMLAWCDETEATLCALDTMGDQR